MKLITLHLSEEQINELDNLVNKGLYPNRAEALRTAVNDLINNEFKIDTKTPRIRCQECGHFKHKNTNGIYRCGICDV